VTVDHRRAFVLVFIAVFILIFVIGVLSEVSLLSSFLRAVLAAVFFTVLSSGVVRAVSRFVISEQEKQELTDINRRSVKQAGENLNITVSDPPADQVSSDNGPEFIPLAARQIDPEVDKAINSDPRRMADIIKKMGFDE